MSLLPLIVGVAISSVDVTPPLIVGVAISSADVAPASLIVK